MNLLHAGARESKPVCSVPSIHHLQPGLKLSMQAACASLQLLACQVPSAAELLLLLGNIRVAKTVEPGETLNSTAASIRAMQQQQL